MQSKTETTKQAYIETYVNRARAVGFDIQATEDGCIYAADDFDETPEIVMVAVPCACESHNEGWHMEEVNERR